MISGDANQNSSPLKAAKKSCSLSVRDMFDDPESIIEYFVARKVDLALQESVTTSNHASLCHGAG